MYKDTCNAISTCYELCFRRCERYNIIMTPHPASSSLHSAAPPPLLRHFAIPKHNVNQTTLHFLRVQTCRTHGTSVMSSSTQKTPPGTPPSPSASLYDMSDDEEGEYNTIRHAKSGRGVKLLYSKSKVRSSPWLLGGWCAFTSR